MRLFKTVIATQLLVTLTAAAPFTFSVVVLHDCPRTTSTCFRRYEDVKLSRYDARMCKEIRGKIHSCANSACRSKMDLPYVHKYIDLTMTSVCNKCRATGICTYRKQLLASRPSQIEPDNNDGQKSDSGAQTPSTGLRHPSFNHCRI